MTFRRLLAAVALVCAAMTGSSGVALADDVSTEEVGPVVLYVTDIPDDDPDGGLIVRSGPSTSTAQIDVLENGTEVTTVSWPVTGFFVEISEPVSGWVGVKFLTHVKPEQPFRHIDAQNAHPADEAPDENSEEASEENPAESSEESSVAPDALALEDESDDGATTSDDAGNGVRGFGALLLILGVGGAIMFVVLRRRDQLPDKVTPEERPGDEPDALAQELAARAAEVQGKR